MLTVSDFLVDHQPVRMPAMEAILDSYFEEHSALLAILWEEIFQSAAGNISQQHLIGVWIMRRPCQRGACTFQS